MDKSLMGKLQAIFEEARSGRMLGMGDIRTRMQMAAQAFANSGLDLGGLKMENLYTFWATNPKGEIIWHDFVANLVVDEGLDDALDKHLRGSAYTAAWYMGLTGTTPSFAAGDDMTTHAGWTENTTYSQGTRPSITFAAVSGKSTDNSGSPCVFSINGAATLGGGFVVSNSTKGGTSGILYGGGAFSGGDKTLGNGDTLNGTVTATAAAS